MAYMSEYELDQYMEYNRNNFEYVEFGRFRNIIANSNITLQELRMFRYKSPMLGLGLSIVLGFLGVDRFYAGNYLLGILKLCTFGLSGIWWVVDWFLITNVIKRKNQRDLYYFLSARRTSSYSVDLNGVKNVLKSQEVQNATKEVWKSVKGVSNTFDLDL